VTLHGFPRVRAYGKGKGSHLCTHPNHFAILLNTRKQKLLKITIYNAIIAQESQKRIKWSFPQETETVSSKIPLKAVMNAMFPSLP